MTKRKEIKLGAGHSYLAREARRLTKFFQPAADKDIVDFEMFKIELERAKALVDHILTGSDIAGVNIRHSGDAFSNNVRSLCDTLELHGQDTVLDAHDLRSADFMRNSGITPLMKKADALEQAVTKRQARIAEGRNSGTEASVVHMRQLRHSMIPAVVNA